MGENQDPKNPCRTPCPAFSPCLSLGCREGRQAGWVWKAGVASGPPASRAQAGPAGRPGGRQGRDGVDEGAVCSFLTPSIDHMPTFRAPDFPPQHPLCGPLALESLLYRPDASSTCAFLLPRLRKVQLLDKVQTHHPWVTSQICHFFILLG